MLESSISKARCLPAVPGASSYHVRNALLPFKISERLSGQIARPRTGGKPGVAAINKFKRRCLAKQAKGGFICRSGAVAIPRSEDNEPVEWHGPFISRSIFIVANRSLDRRALPCPDGLAR